MPVLIHQRKVAFQSEARLLEELGERLVASPEVAVVELIKNAYDADAAWCRVEFKGRNEKLIIKDNGHGITEDEFLNKWMRIATGTKIKEEYSKTYKRKLTGAKGIGRFSVRFLADNLTLETIAYDEKRREKTKLIADFDWTKFSQSQDIRKIKILYKLFKVLDDAESGTTLVMKCLRKTKEGFVFNKGVRSEILKIITPLRGLDASRFDREKEKTLKDPGFDVKFTGIFDKGPQYDENLAKNVLDNYWAKLIIDLDGNKLRYKIYTQEQKGIVFRHTQNYKSDIYRGLRADIRFFPRRAGIFTSKGFDGREAWKWIQGKCGVVVVDHGFLVKPYGFGDDDWLYISQDKAINRRKWRTDIMMCHYPIPDEILKDTAQNPMLYLPRNHQLVGAVFVESGLPDDANININLIPAMDRGGFLDNKSFDDLVEIVRAGIEMLALIDKREQDRIAELKAEEAELVAQNEIQKAIKHIKAIPTLTERDKDRIVSQYAHLAENIKELSEYDRQSRQNLETMGLLGAVAGFMTHESRKILFELKETIKTLHTLSKKHRQIARPLSRIEKNFKEFSEYIDYTSTYIGAVHNGTQLVFEALPQIRKIIGLFDKYVERFNISIQKEIDKDVKTPPVSVALYSGVILNLYTNALKAIAAGSKESKHPKILFKVWNEKKKHIIEITDNGIGIPPTLKQRIWDPLFTTTSQLNNPLGSGMGLGLSLVKRLLRSIGGIIRLVKPKKGFSTCFRVELPMPKKRGRNG